MKAQRQVSTEEAKAYAEKLNMKYVEVSAKDGTHVNSLFHGLAQDMYNKQAELLKKNNAIVVSKLSLRTRIRQMFKSKPKSSSKCSH